MTKDNNGLLKECECSECECKMPILEGNICPPCIRGNHSSFRKIISEIRERFENLPQWEKDYLRRNVK